MIYMRFSRWTKSGTIQRIFQELQKQNLIDIKGEILCLDRTSIKVHPNASGARKTSGDQSIGRSWGLTTKIYAVCTSEKFALKIQLSAGNRHDAP